MFSDTKPHLVYLKGQFLYVTKYVLSPEKLLARYWLIKKDLLEL